MSERFKLSKILLLVFGAAGCITVPYIILSLTGVSSHYPNIVIVCISGLVGGLGFQIGYIFNHAKKQSGNYNITKVLGLQDKLDWKQLVIWVPVLLIISIALFLATQFIGTWQMSNIIILSGSTPLVRNA